MSHYVCNTWVTRVPISNSLYSNYQFKGPFCMLLRLHYHHVYCVWLHVCNSFLSPFTLYNWVRVVGLLQERKQLPYSDAFTVGLHKRLIISTLLKWETVMSLDIIILLKPQVLLRHVRQGQWAGMHFLSPRDLLWLLNGWPDFESPVLKILSLCFPERSKKHTLAKFMFSKTWKALHVLEQGKLWSEHLRGATAILTSANVPF